MTKRITQALLVVDCQVVMELSIDDIPLALMSIFIQKVVDAFVEIYKLGFLVSQASPTVKHFVTGVCDD